MGKEVCLLKFTFVSKYINEVISLLASGDTLHKVALG